MSTHRHNRLNALRTAGRRAAGGLLIEAVERRVLLSGAGAPDSTFAGDGTTTVGFGGSERLYAVETLPGGKLLAAGTSNGRLALAQFRADGTLDKSFDYDGKVISTAVSIVPDDVQRLADGKILVSGSGAAARFNADGSLDTTYGGGDGVVALTFTRPDGTRLGLTSTAIQPDGKVVRVGALSTFLDNGSEFDEWDADGLVIRYRPDGTLDPTFGGGRGYVTLEGISNTEYELVTVAPTGDIVVAGVAAGDPRENQVWEIFDRYSPDGTLKSGASIDPPTRTRVDLRTIAAAPDGTAVVVEGEDNDIVSNYTVFPPTIPSGTTPQYVWPRDIVATAGFQPDGKVVYAGPIAGGFRVDRPDQSDGFGGGDGRVDVIFGGTAPGSPKVVTTDDGGRIVVAGTIGGDFAVARLRGDTTTPPPPPPSGSTSYEAEQAVLSGAVVASNNAGFTGTGFVDYFNLSNDYAEFTVDAASAGSYALTFRYANGGATARALGLKVNGAARGSVSFGPTGSWATWKTVLVTTQLNAGVNKVRLTAAGQSGPNLDSLAVAPTTQQPPPPPPGDGVYQAESATLAGAVKASNTAGYTGSGFADYINPGGDYVEFVVNASLAGRYDLGFRYANGSSAARAMQLRVNSQTQDLTFDRTGGWDNWATETFFSFYLNAGRNVVRLTATGQSGPNLDSMIVQPSGELTFQAEDGTTGGAVVSRDGSGYEGTGFVQYADEGDWVEIPIETSESGRFDLVARYANASGRVQNVTVQIDGDGAGGFNLYPTGSWSTWQLGGAAQRFGLTAGAHRIRLTATTGGGLRLDSIDLNTAPDAFFQVEDAGHAAGDPVVSTAAPGYTGRGFLDFVNPSGGYATWGLGERDLDEARRYVVQFRYANGGATARAMQLSAHDLSTGDTTVLIDRLSFAPTGSWSDWQTTAAKVFLPAPGYRSAVVLTLTAVGESGPNLDWVAVY